jgi:hypothetical protein
VAAFDYVEPFVPRDGGGGGETVVEEGFYGGCFWDGEVFGNEADESTWEGRSIVARDYILKWRVSVTETTW